jgi:protein phosphatase
MGGHEAGNVASAMTVEAMGQFIDARLAPGDTTLPFQPGEATGEHLLVEAVRFANRRVFEARQGKKMGSTVVAALFEHRNVGDTVLVGSDDVSSAFPVSLVNVGDSRAYMWRNNELVQITNDHSLVFELYRNGRITREEMKTHPRKNVITRAVGSEGYVAPELYHVEARSGDMLLLCSDGLTSMVDDQDIRMELSQEENPVDIAENLVTAANRAGGRDNITVVIARVS